MFEGIVLMNEFQELCVHVRALRSAVAQDTRFFAGVSHYTDHLYDLLTETPSKLSQDEIGILADKIEAFFAPWRPSGDGLYIPPMQTRSIDPAVKDITRLVEVLKKMPAAVFLHLRDEYVRSIATGQTPTLGAARNEVVFIGHGRSQLWARVKVYVEEELRLRTVNFESESRTGKSVTQILETVLDQSGFAILILTAEDQTSDGEMRARQNVVHEAGLFQGRLGFQRAVLLVQEGVTEFSNVAGLQHIRFHEDKVEQTFYELHRVLKREGLLL